MTLRLDLTPELEHRLRERAAAEGKDLMAVALEAVEQRLSEPNGSLSESIAKDRMEAWNRFLAATRGHAATLPAGYFADDDRGRIYEGRGE
ncbi:MAG: hypothetical protein AABZ08_11230 [Planctomycetota bacterium]